MGPVAPPARIHSGCDNILTSTSRGTIVFGGRGRTHKLLQSLFVAESLKHSGRRARSRVPEVVLFLLAAGLAVPCEADIMYVSNTVGNTIESFTAGGVGSVFANTGLSKPFGLAFDSAGNLYGVNNSGNSIEEFTPGGVGSVFASGGFDNPLGMAFDSAGDLYVANLNINTIQEFTPGGAGSVFANTGMNRPYGIAFDSAGNLYVANAGDNTIEKFTPGGAGSVFASGLNGPICLAFDSAGNLFVVDNGDDTIEKIAPGGVESLFASTGLNSPHFIAFTNDAGSPLLLPNQTPEPSTWTLFALGGTSLLVAKWRRIDAGC